MNTPDIKKLKRLAEVCRKAGITNFKYHQDGSYEFALDPTVQPAQSFTKRQSRQDTKSTVNEEGVFSPGDFDAEVLTDDQKLFWSVLPADGPSASSEGEIS